MSKSINQIFVNNKELLDNDAVAELVEYCRELEGEIIENKQSKQFSFEAKLNVLVNEIYSGIKETFKDEEESKRFNETPLPDYRQRLINLKEYLQAFGRDNQFNFDV